MTYQDLPGKGPPDVLPVISIPEEYGVDFTRPPDPAPLWVGGVRELPFLALRICRYEGHSALP